MATGGGETILHPPSSDDLPFNAKKASTINISTYTHQPATNNANPLKVPTLTSIRSNSSDSNNNETVKSPGNPNNTGLMYDRHENYTNTNTTDVNDVSMKIDFSDIFRDSSYTHDSTTWTQCCCNALFWIWENLSCKDLDIAVYKGLLALVLLMNLFNLLTEVLLLLSEFKVIDSDYDDQLDDDGGPRVGLQILYSLGTIAVLANCLLILKLIYRPTTRSALNSALLIVFLLILYIVQLAMYLKYRDDSAKHNVLFLSIVALFFMLQAVSSILLYRYWEYAMFSFDDAIDFHDLFLDTVSGEDYNSSSQKHYLDIRDVTGRKRGGTGGGSSNSGNSGSRNPSSSRAILQAVGSAETVNANGNRSLTPVHEIDEESPSSSGDGRKRLSHQSQSQISRSFAASIRASFTFGSTPRVNHPPAPQRPQKTPHNSRNNSRNTTKRGTPRGTRARHASMMLSNENVSLHNSLLQQQHLTSGSHSGGHSGGGGSTRQSHTNSTITNLKLAKFFDHVATTSTTTTASRHTTKNSINTTTTTTTISPLPHDLPRPPPIVIPSNRSQQSSYASHLSDSDSKASPSAALAAFTSATSHHTTTTNNNNNNNSRPTKPPAISHPDDLNLTHTNTTAIPSGIEPTASQSTSVANTPSASHNSTVANFVSNLIVGGGNSNSRSRTSSASGGTSSNQLYNMFPFRTNSNNPGWSSNSQQSQTSLIEAVTISPLPVTTTITTNTTASGVVSPISSTIQQNVFQPATTSTTSAGVTSVGRNREEQGETGERDQNYEV